MATRISYDNDGFAQYLGWALPGIDADDASWAIAKVIRTVDEITGYEWADGNQNFDNIWNNRAILTYAPNPSLTLEVYQDIIPSGTIPGTVFDAGVDLGSAEIILNSTMMKRVVSGPVGNECVVSGTQFTTGVTIQAEDWLFVRVRL